MDRLIKIYFSENVLPKLTDKQKEKYRLLVDNGDQFLGIVRGSRQLIWTIANEDNIHALIAFLNSIGKEIIVCGAFLQNGDNVDTFNYDKEEYDKFFVPEEIVIDGEKTYIATAEPCTKNWKPFFLCDRYSQERTDENETNR